MSSKWWDQAHTTVGHGIHSQHNAQATKETILKETRVRERAASPEKFFSPHNSLYRTHTNVPGLIQGEPIEHRHHAYSKTLEELKLYQTAPATTNTLSVPVPPEVVGHQPIKTKHLPHMAHHHYFGWQPPTPESRVAVVDSKINHYKMGDAQTYNHKVFTKASLITSRKA